MYTNVYIFMYCNHICTLLFQWFIYVLLIFREALSVMTSISASSPPSVSSPSSIAYKRISGSSPAGFYPRAEACPEAWMLRPLLDISY